MVTKDSGRVSYTRIRALFLAVLCFSFLSSLEFVPFYFDEQGSSVRSPELRHQCRQVTVLSKSVNN